MRLDSKKIRWMCALTAMAIFIVLAGCAEQPQDFDPGMMEDPGALVDDTAVPAPDDAETMADVVGSFTMPNSFRMTVDDGDMTQTMWMKMDGEQAAKMRIEHASEQGTEVMVMDFEGGQMVSYNVETKEGFSVPISEQEAADAPMPWDEYDETFKIVGSEEINGVDCWIVETADEEDMRAWIGKADGLMRQIQEGDQTVVFTIDDKDAVDDSAFDVPSDVELTDLSVGMEE